MNDAIDRLLVERAAMEQGFSNGFVASMVVHGLVVGIPLLAALLLPHEPPIKIIDGFAVVLPRGGGGTPHQAAAAPQPTAAPPVTTPAQPPKEEPAPKIVKPPKEEPRKGLAELDAKKGKKPKEDKPQPRSGGAQGGTGTAAVTPGISLSLPPGPGVPDGVDSGDWYLASVQQRIWTIWMQQVHSGMTQSVTVAFSIQADGTVADVSILQTSGASLLDLAAQRAVYSAAPFGPLPKNYGISRITIQCVFKAAE